MYYPNKAIYVGFWANNEPDGRGHYFYPNGEYYEGQFSRGKRHGSGKYNYVTGDVYDGGWAEDLKFGQGTMRFATGDRYALLTQLRRHVRQRRRRARLRLVPALLRQQVRRPLRRWTEKRQRTNSVLQRVQS
jgi:hypothetical protein